MNSTDSTATTRFQQVQATLRELASGKEAAFGGLLLWELPRDGLLQASLQEIRLIAPERETSCCGRTAGEDRSRSARSGLIQGLRGVQPFDGSRFPRFPWGGRAAQEQEVQFIADWIDDGCPAGDRQIASLGLPVLEVQTSRATVESVPELEKERRVGIAAGYQPQPGELKQRLNIDCLNADQLEQLRHAFRRMYEFNRWPEDTRSYNNAALIHQNHCQHGWERFLPWHRIYLYEFELILQDLCPGVTMPYWDWTMPGYKPERPQDGPRIPVSLQAFLTDASLEYLGRHGIPTGPLQSLVGKNFYSQSAFFNQVTEAIGQQYTTGESRKRFIDALLEANSLWYPLRYPGEFFRHNQPSTINKVIQYHYPTAGDIGQILALTTFRDFGGGSLYNDSFGFLDQNPHNTMHIWTGGMNPAVNAGQAPADRNTGVAVAGRKFHKREDLYSQPMYGDMFSNLTASYDPIFWPIHANVDRLWWEWQQMHPDSTPADLDAVLTPWSYTTRDTLDMHRFGYEYVKSASIVPVGTEAPVGRFVSPPIEVSDAVRAGFRQAEVRLHRVPQLPRSCFIRVFLNLPDADAYTDIHRDEYAGYLAIFGHGQCYGGPGHCDVPPLRRRPHDLRPRHHNTPRNHRINVTDCVKRLFDKGANSLQLTLVTLGVDYEEETELLRLQGVSLNFLD